MYRQPGGRLKEEAAHSLLFQVWCQLKWPVLRLFRRRVKFCVSWRLGGIGSIVQRRAVVADLFILLDFSSRYFFQNRVLLKFLFDESFEFERRSLKQGERLLQLRRQHLRQRHFL